MGKTTKHQQLILLEPEKAELLAKLAKETRIPRQEYLREAIDLLLTKYRMLKPKRKP
jgi:predicted DNA-binding protein